MGYAGYVPAKIAQFEFTPLEQARARSERACRLRALQRAACGARAPLRRAPARIAPLSGRCAAAGVRR
jgi:hypothetical protein